MTDKEFDAAAEAIRKRLDRKFDDAYEQLFANPKLTGRALDKAIDALYARRDREEEAELEKLEELRDQQEDEEFERLEELRDQQEDEEFERLEEEKEARREAVAEAAEEAAREMAEDDSEDLMGRVDDFYVPKVPSFLGGGRSGGKAFPPRSSNGSGAVDYETYSESDPNDYDPEEVDGGPEAEDEYFETGEDPEDEELYDF